MNINYKPSQIELFPSNSAALDELNKPRFFLASLTLSIESLVILSILGIMLTLFSFAIGVEQGKRSVAQALDERVAQAWNVGARRAHPTMIAASVTSTMPQQATAKPVAPIVAGSGNKGVVVMHTQAQPVGVKPMVKQTVVAAPKVAMLVPQAARMTVQLATYRSENYARDEAIQLRGKGIQTFLVKSGEFWLVCSGQFKSKEDAAGFINKLPSKYRKAVQLRRF